MDISILHEDNDLVVINKPSGIVVNRVESVKGETIQSWVETYIKFQIPKYKFQIEKTDFISRSGVVHRLDRDTSGALIIAKNEKAFKDLQMQFKDRTVKKTYVALVHGEVKPAKGIIKAPIGRLPWNRSRFGVTIGGKEAETSYQVKNIYTKNNKIYSLIEYYPRSGRTHQIRVHAKYIKHPVVSDPWYGGKKQSKKDLSFCPRLFLHAYKICFLQPKICKRIEVEAPLPKDLQNVILSFES